MNNQCQIIKEGIPIGFFDSKIHAQEALKKYVDKGYIKEV